MVAAGRDLFDEGSDLSEDVNGGRSTSWNFLCIERGRNIRGMGGIRGSMDRFEVICVSDEVQCWTGDVLLVGKLEELVTSDNCQDPELSPPKCAKLRLHLNIGSRSKNLP